MRYGPVPFVGAIPYFFVLVFIVCAYLVEEVRIFGVRETERIVARMLRIAAVTLFFGFTLYLAFKH